MRIFFWLFYLQNLHYTELSCLKPCVSEASLLEYLHTQCEGEFYHYKEVILCCIIQKQIYLFCMPCNNFKYLSFLPGQDSSNKTKKGRKEIISCYVWRKMSAEIVWLFKLPVAKGRRHLSLEPWVRLGHNFTSCLKLWSQKRDKSLLFKPYQ